MTPRVSQATADALRLFRHARDRYQGVLAARDIPNEEYQRTYDNYLLSAAAFAAQAEAELVYGECDCTDGCDACDDGFFEHRTGRSVKPSAQVPANEHSCEVSAPASRPELRLLCLLVKDRSGKSRPLPVHTLRPVPPRVGPVGRWSLASDAAFHLRETRAERPSPEVLARYSRQRQTDAVCAHSRTV